MSSRAAANCTYCITTSGWCRLGSVLCYTADVLVDQLRVILTTPIPRFCIGLAGLVCRANVALPLGGRGRMRPNPEDEDDDRNDVGHRGPQLMLAATSNILRLESKLRPIRYLPLRQ